MLGKAAPRKRGLIPDTVQPAKRPKVERESRRILQYEQSTERKFKKRQFKDVLEELVLRVESNDRQLTNNLVKELDSEHVRVLESDSFEESAGILMKTCISAKVDSVASKVFICLMGIFGRASNTDRRKFILSLEEDVEGIFEKNSLDANVLSLYTSALNDAIIQPGEVPEKIRLIARRCLAYSSLSATSNRVSALEFLVAMCASEKPCPEERSKECEKHLARLSEDRDFRVRTAASEGLLRMSRTGCKLSKPSYKVAKSFMKDIDPTIRINAIRLLIYYANRVRHGKETTAGKGTTSFTDDAFSAVCDAMNDIEIAVRVEAAKTLGDFETVSNDLIDQTLDKKMMRSNANAQVVKVDQSLFALSKKASAQNDRRWKFARKAPPKAEAKGGWSRGKELNATCPDGGAKEEEEDADSIIPHGACGAFVTALEDEFMDVRKAAVYSLGRLACTRPTFAVSALEYLADMFNDEIADVRLDAIKALTPLIAHGQLNSEQLNVIVKCLDDAMPEARQAMRELLKRAQFVDVNCIELCVRALLACQKRFPKDKEQVFSCMADIGYNHAVQVQSIMRSLLDIHLIFHTREPSIEDQEYVGKLITVLNAASQTPSMVQVMPEFVHRHYRFLRSSFPHLVRPIRVLDEQQQCGKARRSSEKTNDKAEEILTKTYARLCEVANSAHLGDRNLKRDDIFRDTSAISLYNESVSGAARLIFCLGEVSATVDSCSHTVLRGGELINVKQLIKQSLEDMQCIEHQFFGISDQIHAYLVHCRMFLLFLELLGWLLQVMAPQQEVIEMAERILFDIKSQISYDREMPEPLSNFITSCYNVFFPEINRNADEKQKIITPTTIIHLLEKSIPQLPSRLPPISSIHLKFAKITTPNKDTAVEEVLKFVANLPHGIPLEFQLFNMESADLPNVRIKTLYPDGKFDVMRPRKEEFKQEEQHFAVSTQVKITCGSPWSEAAEIDIVIGVESANGIFVPLFASPSCFSPAHVRVRIHPHSR